MEKAEMKLVRFGEENVIATSGLGLTIHATADGIRDNFYVTYKGKNYSLFPNLEYYARNNITITGNISTVGEELGGYLMVNRASQIYVSDVDNFNPYDYGVSTDLDGLSYEDDKELAPGQKTNFDGTYMWGAYFIDETAEPVYGFFKVGTEGFKIADPNTGTVYDQ